MQPQVTVMPIPSTQRSRDEIARIADATYQGLVRPQLRPEDGGKFVAPDVDTGDYEVDEDDYAVIHRLQGRRPGAEIWQLWSTPASPPL